MLLDGNPLRVWNLAQVQQKLGISVGSPVFELLVSAGQVQGVSLVRIMGHNPDIDVAGVPEDVWEGGGLYPFQTSAQSLEILSDNAADAAAGTGLRTARVTGLDADYAEITENVTLNGVGVVPLINQYLRINELVGLTAGSGETNAGIVTLRVAGAGAVQAVMDTGDGRAHNGIYTVPAGKTGFITLGIFQMLRAVTASETSEIALHFREQGGVNILRNLFVLWTSGTSSSDIPLQYPVRVPAKMDMWASIHFVSANNTSITVTLFLVLIDNDLLA